MRLSIAMLWAACLSGQDQPFTISWAEGKCVGCKVARDLTDVRWLSRTEAWGVGVGDPPPAFYHTLVHTTDAGRTWKELPESKQYAVPLTFTFLDAAHGWYSCSNVDCDNIIGSNLYRTADGRNWRVISHQGMMAMAFSDPDHGWGKEFGVDNSGGLVRTADGGLTWSKIQVPRLNKIENTVLLSGHIGWVTQREGTELVFFRTTDGARTWQESRLALPEGWSEVRQLSFLDQNHGWMVLKRKQDDRLRLLSTIDGGQTWQTVALPDAQNSLWWMDVVAFTTEKTGFVFSTGSAAPTRTGVTQELLFTSDAGAHWTRHKLPYSIYGCQALEGGLLCTADRVKSHFGVLTIHPK